MNLINLLKLPPRGTLSCICAAVVIVFDMAVSPCAADLDATLGLHQLQFGLCQLQLQVPQLLLQSVLLLVRWLAVRLVPARGRSLKGSQGCEKVPTVVTAHYFTLHGHTTEDAR